jgi:hypothetical protein
MSRAKRRLIVGLLIVIVAIVVWAALAFVQAVLDVPRQAYAVWWTADLFIAYIEHHDGAWPRSWEDLRPFVEGTLEVSESRDRHGRRIVEFRPKASIEELQRRVVIDWNADTRKLLEAPLVADGPPFRVIYLRNGKSRHYEGREPNQMIRDYLDSRRRQKAK